MMADHRMNDQALNHYLDDIAAGAPVSLNDGVDVELVETFRALRSLAQTPPGESARNRVDRTVENAIDQIGKSPRERVGPLNGHMTSATGNQRRYGAPQSMPDASRRRPLNLTHPKSFVSTRFAWVIAAALVVLAVGVSYLVVGPTSPWPRHRKTVPAAQVVASPTAEPSTDQTLLEFTLPPEALPQGQNISSGLAHFTIPPGTRSTWTSYCCAGPMIEYVVAGTYSVRAAAAVQVVRADGRVDQVAADEEVTLNAGDSLISRNETSVEGANTGSGSVELLSWVLIEDSGFGGHALSGWLSGNADVHGTIDVYPELMTVTIRRLTLDPNGALPAPQLGTTQFVVTLPSNLTGTPVTNTIGSNAGGVLNWGKEPAEVYVLTATQAGPTEASPEPGSPTS